MRYCDLGLVFGCFCGCLFSAARLAGFGFSSVGLFSWIFRFACVDCWFLLVWLLIGGCGLVEVVMLTVLFWF